MKKSEQNIKNFFKSTILLSGTPDWRQKALSIEFSENTCSCPPKMAMDNGWICRPILNLIDCSKEDWPAAIRNVLYRENKIWREGNKLFKPTILVNCTSIDDIYNLTEVPWFKANTGKNFHFISIHSGKSIDGEDGEVVDITAEIDGESCKSEEAYEKIEQIDNDCFHDDLPIIVAQVQMIGEGINVSSFNAVVTSSCSDKTAMQQIGRAVRNFKVTRDMVEVKDVHEKVMKPKAGFFNKLLGKKEEVDVVKHVEVKQPHVFTKVNDGHANVYVIKDNLEDLYDLIANLETSYNLTDKCFTWGDKIDIPAGSSPDVVDEAEFCKLQKSKWHKIDESNPEIIEIINHARDAVLDNAMTSWMNDDTDGNGRPDGEDFKELTSKLVEDGYVNAWTNRKNGIEYDVLYEFMVNTIRTLLKSETNKKIWNVDRRIFLDMAFGSDAATEFFMTHLSDSVVKSLGK